MLYSLIEGVVIIIEVNATNSQSNGRGFESQPGTKMCFGKAYLSLSTQL